MASDDGDFAIEIAARLRKLYFDACTLLDEMDRHEFEWQGPFWTAAAQCRTVLRFGVLPTVLKSSNLMTDPAFRHEIKQGGMQP